MSKLKHNEFIKFATEKYGALDFTQSESIFIQEMIDEIEINTRLKKSMTEIGNKKPPFDKLYEFYKQLEK